MCAHVLTYNYYRQIFAKYEDPFVPKNQTLVFQPLFTFEFLKKTFVKKLFNSFYIKKHAGQGATRSALAIGFVFSCVC